MDSAPNNPKDSGRENWMQMNMEVMDNASSGKLRWILLPVAPALEKCTYKKDIKKAHSKEIKRINRKGKKPISAILGFEKLVNRFIISTFSMPSPLLKHYAQAKR